MAEDPKMVPDAPQKPPNAWMRLSPRARWIAGAAGTIVVLAGVILGVSALSAPKSTETATMQLTTAQESELAYQKGLTALRSGDTTAAVEALEKAVLLDPTNEGARQALARAQSTAVASSNPDTDDATDPDGSSSDPKPKPKPEPKPEPEDPAFNKPVKDLKGLLPEEAEGFALGSATATEADATVSGTPNNPMTVTSRSLWTVHDRKTPDGAAKFVKSVSKSLYAKDAAAPSIDGAKAYFGTDGTRFATVVYVRGRYVFEVVLTSLEGSPAQLKAEAEAASRAFPDELP